MSVAKKAGAERLRPSSWSLFEVFPPMNAVGDMQAVSATILCRLFECHVKKHRG